MKFNIKFIFLLLLSIQPVLAQKFHWAKIIGGQSGTITDIICAVDSSGNIYGTGYFIGTVDFDPGPGVKVLSSPENRDVFLLKLDANCNFIWAKQFGGKDSDKGQSISIDRTGYVYVSGYFKETVDFDPGVHVVSKSSNGNNDIFISKFDSLGNFIWVKTIGGTQEDRLKATYLDAAGNLYSTGYFSETADFDPGAGVFNVSEDGIQDAFILKLNNEGNFVWVKRIGNLWIESGSAIHVDQSGDVYVAGTFDKTVDFDPGPKTFQLTNERQYDFSNFVVKLTSDGKFKWAREIGPNSDFSIAFDSIGNFYTMGTFEATEDLDPTVGVSELTSNGMKDLFITKFNFDGEFSWAKKIGGTELEHGNSIVTDRSGNAVVTGYFQDVVDFDPNAGLKNLTSSGEADIFISTIDPSGNLLDVKKIGGKKFDLGVQVLVDKPGNILLMGLIEGAVDLDPGDGSFLLTCDKTSYFINKFSK